LRVEPGPSVVPEWLLTRLPLLGQSGRAKTATCRKNQVQRARRARSAAATK
jgi:hypothetical protein